MHVAIRDRNDAGRDALARYVDSIRVSARLASRGVKRERNLALFRRLAKEIEYDWRDDGSASQDRASVDGGFTVFLLLDTRVIDGKKSHRRQ